MTSLALFLAMLIPLAIIYTILVLFCLTLYRTLSVIDAHNQQIPPGRVWLNLIPLFNLIWPLILNPKISASIRNQLEENGAEEKGDYALALGRTYPILQLVTILPLPEPVESLCSLASLVIFIIFWVKIGNYRTKILRAGRVDPSFTAVNNKTDLLD